MEAGHREEQRLPDASKGHGVPLPGAFRVGLPAEWVRSHLLPGRGRDQGRGEPVKRARRLGQTVHRGGGPEAEWGRAWLSLLGRAAFLILQGRPACGRGRCVCLLAQPLSGQGARGRPGTELISRAGPLHKGALGFFLENQQQEEAGEAPAREEAPGQGLSAGFACRLPCRSWGTVHKQQMSPPEL